MDSTETEEGWLETADGAKLYTKTWKPTGGQPRARVAFIHGFSDHCNNYPELFSTFAKRGIAVYAFDQRGWGRSVQTKGQRGNSGPNAQVMEDITTFLRSLPSHASAPLFLMGHSMGGGEVIVWASTAAPPDLLSKIRGFLLEAPLIGLNPAAKPWKLTVALGRLAAKVMPTMPLVQKLDASALSRDPAVCKAWLEDDLCHDTGTLEQLAGMLDRVGDLDSGRTVMKEGLGEGAKTRLWLAHGSGDAVCDFEASRRWFERVEVADKEFRSYDGWRVDVPFWNMRLVWEGLLTSSVRYHKLHSEPNGDGATFAKDAADWILARSDSGDDTQRSTLQPKL